MIDQKEQLVPEQLVPQPAITFTKTGNGKRSSQRWTNGELPYPFTGYEEIVSKCRAVNFAALMEDGTLYQLQTVSLSYQPNLRVR